MLKFFAVLLLIAAAALLWLAQGIMPEDVTDINNLSALIYGGGILKSAAILCATFSLILWIAIIRRAKRRAKEAAVRAQLQESGGAATMSYEKEEPLTDDDRRVIQRELVLLAVVLGLFSLVPLLILFLVGPEHRATVFVAMIPWVAVMGMFWVRGYGKKRDLLNAGIKKVIRGIITERFHKTHTSRHPHSNEESTTSAPHLRIGNQELFVSYRMYRRYHVGDAVEIHYCSTGVAFGMDTSIVLAHSKIEGASVVALA